MKILGLSAYYHDSAACLVVDGKLVAAAQEERFSRIRHDSGFPGKSIAFCLEFEGISLSDIDYIVFYDKPLKKFNRLISTYIDNAPYGYELYAASLPSWLNGKLFQNEVLVEQFSDVFGVDIKDRLLFSEHHLSHAGSAFYPSPFNQAAILTIDGVGEWATTTLARGEGSRIKMLKEIAYPHSLGLFYAALTYFLGFKVNSGEYKVMGLAPYGNPIYVNRIREHLIDICIDGSFRLNMEYFDYCRKLSMVGEKFEKLFGIPRRHPESALTQVHMDIAASLQIVTEEVVVGLARSAAKETGSANLCMAGGVALNCVANGKLLREKIFKNIWVQPAAGDAGGAIGAALCVYHMMLEKPRLNTLTDGMNGAYLGPSYTQSMIEKHLSDAGAVYSVLSDDEIIRKTAKALADGCAVGWHQGRMEFGPRALGARSIIADPRSETVQRTLNLKVKQRESFRPFAPSVLAKKAADWFKIDTESPYMLLIAEIAENHRRKITEEDNALFGIDKLNIPRSSIPAVTHVDYTARIQTVTADSNNRYYQLLSEFERITGCPILVNTSFNVRGEPIVMTPMDAYNCFMGTEIEVLVVGNCYLNKEIQPLHLKTEYKSRYELD